MRCCRRTISKQHVKVSRLCDILRASYSANCTTQNWFSKRAPMLVYLAEVHQHRGRISSLSWAYKHSQAPFSYHFGFSDPNRCFHVSDTTCSPSYGLCWDLVEFKFSSLKLHAQNPFKSAQEPHRTQKVPQRIWSFYWKSLLIFPSNPIPFPPYKAL